MIGYWLPTEDNQTLGRASPDLRTLGAAFNLQLIYNMSGKAELSRYSPATVAVLSLHQPAMIVPDNHALSLRVQAGYKSTR